MKKFYSVLIKNNVNLTGHASHRGNSKFDDLYHEMGHLLHNKNTCLKDSFWGRLSTKSTKAFMADKEKLKTAGKISWYAQKILKNSLRNASMHFVQAVNFLMTS